MGALTRTRRDMTQTTRQERRARFAIAGATVVLLVCALIEAWIVLSSVSPSDGTIGLDLHFYQANTTSWLAGDGFYRAGQLAGPYVVADGDAMYPPTVLLLLVPFTVGVPAVLWWAIPLGIAAATIVWVRPARWAWPVLLAIFVYHRTWMILVFGNPAMWALAALSVGAVWRWPAALAVLTLTFAPFALLGVRDRRWWLTAAVLVAVSVPFGAMWIDFAHVLLWAQSPHGFEYTLGEWPIAIALLVVVRSGTRPRRSIGRGAPAQVVPASPLVQGP